MGFFIVFCLGIATGILAVTFVWGDLPTAIYGYYQRQMGYVAARPIENAQPAKPLPEGGYEPQTGSAVLNAQMAEVFVALGRLFRSPTPDDYRTAVELIEYHDKEFSLLIEIMRDTASVFIPKARDGSTTILSYLYDIAQENISQRTINRYMHKSGNISVLEYLITDAEYLFNEHALQVMLGDRSLDLVTTPNIVMPEGIFNERI